MLRARSLSNAVGISEVPGSHVHRCGSVTDIAIVQDIEICQAAATVPATERVKTRWRTCAARAENQISARRKETGPTESH